MKTLNIDSPIAQRLAEIALFESIQARFGMYPSRMVSQIKLWALQCSDKDPIGLARRLKVLVGFQISSGLDDITRALMSGSVKGLENVDSEETFLDVLFRFFHARDLLNILRDIENYSQRHNLNSVDYTNWLRSEAQVVCDWAFDETIRVMREELKRS
jgi:hypothetical protein